MIDAFRHGFVLFVDGRKRQRATPVLGHRGASEGARNAGALWMEDHLKTVISVVMSVGCVLDQRASAVDALDVSCSA